MSLCCNFCSENEALLIEMDENSLEVDGDEIIEFNDLLLDVLNLRLDGGIICTECKDQLLNFYHFKKNARCSINSLEWNQRLELFEKLNMFLDDNGFTEELAVLRYRQCFTVVPESKRDLMQNFQSWQPQVLLENSEQLENNRDETKNLNIKKCESESNQEDYDTTDMIKQEILLAQIAQDESRKTEESASKRLRTTKEQRQWANDTTKNCYSVEQQEEGIVPIWSCLLCGKIYHSAQALRLHLLAKHLNEENDLHEENSSITQADIEETILRHVSRENKFKCSKCEASFNSATHLRHHLQQHSKNKLSASDLKSFAEQRKSKPMKYDWTCKECFFQFSNQRSFDSHIRLHETIRGLCQFTELHRCDQCNMFFRSVDDMTIHVEAHAENQTVLIAAEGVALQKTILFKRLPAVTNGNLVCGHCERRFDNENSCKSHLLLHHVNPIICPRDGRPFNAIQPYICHLQKVHSDMLPQSLLCTHCKMKFENIYERLAHMKNCDAKKFVCDHCDKTFSTKNYLNSHLKREMGLLSCSCQVCGKILKAKDELRIHMRSHTREKPFQCSLCTKSYSTTSARASHMETHKDTVIQCEICSVKFVARRHYVIHYKRYHDEEYRARKFQEQTCKFCHLQFLRKDRLREHLLKAHSSEVL